MHTMLFCNHECILCPRTRTYCTPPPATAMQHEHQRYQLNSDVTTCSSHSFDASMEANPKDQVLFSCKHSDEDEVLASAASEGENAKVCCLLI